MTASTIFALSTPLGRSGLCIFRLSGPRSLLVSNTICNKNLALKPRQMQRIKVQFEDRLIDSGLACFYSAPNSATGEDVVEFNLHGSLAVIDSMNDLFKRFVHFGVREAERGEFSKRALINGKISLTEAEALSDLLDSETKVQLSIFQSNFSGNIDRFVNNIQESLLTTISALEASIEFGETDGVESSSNNYISELKPVVEKLMTASGDSHLYERIRNGFQVLIYGRPNVGKSSLMNYLAGKKVSIVTDRPGTTRDLVQFDAHISGLPVRIIDSAGVRETDCEIEKIGVELSKKALEDADVVLLISDSKYEDLEFPDLEKRFGEKLIFVRSKSDLMEEDDKKLQNSGSRCIVSSTTGEGIELLKSRITALCIKKNELSSLSTKILMNMRQKGCIHDCLKHLENALVSKDELVKIDLIKRSLQSLRQIRGEYINTEEIFDRIFSKFCIGK